MADSVHIAHPHALGFSRRLCVPRTGRFRCYSYFLWCRTRPVFSSRSRVRGESCTVSVVFQPPYGCGPLLYLPYLLHLSSFCRLSFLLPAANLYRLANHPRNIRKVDNNHPCQPAATSLVPALPCRRAQGSRGGAVLPSNLLSTHPQIPIAISLSVWHPSCRV